MEGDPNSRPQNRKAPMKKGNHAAAGSVHRGIPPYRC